MPTSRISAQLLAGALPGLKQGAQAFAGGGMAFDQARDKEMNLQSQLAQRLAATQLANAKASELQRHAASQAPAALRSNALLSNGIPLDAADDVQTFLQTGKLGAQYDALPADQEGPVLPRPGWESKLGGVGRQLAAMQTAIALGDKNSENVAKATQIARSSALSDAIQAGTLDPTKVAAAEYAVKGSAPFHFSEYGIGNNVTGALDNNNGVAQLFAKNRQAEIQAREAQAGASRASAASSYASADNSRASAARTRQDTEMGSKGVLQQTDQGLVLVNPRNGTVTPVLGGDGAPLTKPQSPAKALPSSAAKGYLENQTALRNIDAALQMLDGKTVGGLKGDPNATGKKGYVPDAVLARLDPDGVATRAMIADIGSLKIHDRSGAAVTASETPRLKPFVPAATDDPETVMKKLKLFKQNYQAIAQEAEQFYRESGYNVPDFKPATPSVSAAPAGGGWAIQKVN